MLSLSGKLVVWRELLLKPAQARRKELCVPLKLGRLYLNGQEKADWYTYDAIFLDQEYRTDYRGALVIDIGAHRGLYSAYCLLNGARGVMAYEPAPGNFEFLRQTVESYRHKSSEVEIHQCAVGSRTGTATFHIYDASWSHSLVLREKRKLIDTKEVALVSFESVVDRAAAKRKDGERLIVKMDTEGAEYDILLNSSPRVLKPIDELFAEVHGYAPGNPNTLLSHLRDCGFVGLPQTLTSGSNQVVHGWRAS